MNYHFLDYTLDTTARTLFRNGTECPIPNKVYKFLRLLIEHAGDTVTREQLEAGVWENRIVTDSTLYRMVARLRSVLDEQPGSDPIIQTIHGEGYRFMPTVQIEQTDPVEARPIEQPTLRTPQAPGNARPWRLIAPLLILVLAAIVWLNVRSVTSGEPSLLSRADASVVNVQLIPAMLSSRLSAHTEPDWLFEGGMYYLAELFNQNRSVRVRPPRKEWLDTTDQAALAIDLIQNGDTDAAILADMSYDGERYFASVLLRNESGIVAEQQFDSQSIRRLFEDVALWTREQVIQSPSTAQAVLPDAGQTESLMSTDEFAVESYIRGMARQLRGDHDQAIRLFTMATDQDPDFIVAWYELAVAERSQGNYQRALAILDSLEPAPQEMRVRILNARGIAFWRQGQYELANAQFTQALEVARDRQDPALVRLVLTNVGLTALAMDDLNTARDALDEALSLTEPVRDAAIYGSIRNSMARLEHQSGHPLEAIAHVRQAIDAFARAGNLRSEASARSRLSGYLIEQGQLIDARTLAEESLTVRRDLNDRSGQISSLGKLARIAMLEGHLSDAEALWREVLSLNAQAEHREEPGLIHANIADMHLRAGHLSQASTQIELLGSEASRSGSERLGRAHASLLFRLDLAEGRLEQAEARLETLDLSDADNRVQLARLQHLQQQSDLAIETYRAAIAEVDEHSNRKRQIAYRLALADLLMDIDRLNEAREVLDLAFELKPEDYPALRIKARLLAAEGQRMQASVLMNELKQSANQWWTAEDQQRLESYRRPSAETTESGSNQGSD